MQQRPVYTCIYYMHIDPVYFSVHLIIFHNCWGALTYVDPVGLAQQKLLHRNLSRLMISLVEPSWTQSSTLYERKPQKKQRKPELDWCSCLFPSSFEKCGKECHRLPGHYRQDPALPVGLLADPWQWDKLRAESQKTTFLWLLMFTFVFFRILLILHWSTEISLWQVKWTVLDPAWCWSLDQSKLLFDLPFILNPAWFCKSD